jgi:hypothetical protein
MITFENVEPLYQRYLDMLKDEVDLFGVKPTELRHLLGRLGEFHCVKEVKGSLPKATNQPGYDVIAQNGKKISVKTTAQKSGFVSIADGTKDLADELMLVQYADGKLSTVYHGCIQAAWDKARPFRSTRELEISVARTLASNR